MLGFDIPNKITLSAWFLHCHYFEVSDKVVFLYPDQSFYNYAFGESPTFCNFWLQYCWWGHSIAFSLQAFVQMLANFVVEGQELSNGRAAPHRHTFRFYTIDVHEVFCLLNKMNIKKAVGLDKLPCSLLKTAANVVSPSLTHKFDQSIMSSIFPDEWKLAKVTPVYRP